MDFKPESAAVTSPDRTLQTTTGKRTNHHHTPTTSSSFSGGDGGGCIHSPATSSEEEEDMANCLIMLAHSVSPLKQEDESDHDTYYQKTRTLKIRSVTEMAVATVTTTATGGGNSGHQPAYECKTCNRGFPSFQALGGHRASHKKPKLAVVSPPPEYSKHEQPQVVSINITTTNKSSSPATTPEKNNKLPKVHECSICGSEFLSGQALGGHMRRHRQAPPTKAKASPEAATAHVHHMMQKSPVMCVDLNLPPPEVVDDGHSNFQLTSGSSSQQHIVFSAAALVDCHY